MSQLHAVWPMPLSASTIISISDKLEHAAFGSAIKFAPALRVIPSTKRAIQGEHVRF